MTGLHQFLVFLLATAFIQNLVLTTGFGSSIMLRIVRRPGDIWLFGGFMTAFSVLTVLIAYPLDSLIGTGQAAKLLRPLMMVAIAAVLYALASFWLHRALPSVYRRVSRLLPLAAFNNLVIGIALIINHQFALGLAGAIGPVSYTHLAANTVFGWLQTCYFCLDAQILRKRIHSQIQKPDL